MPSPFRCGPLLLVIAGAAAGCASPSAEPQACQTSAECSASARCVSGACVSNAPPVASVSLPAGALEASLLLTFDGSGSSDPDAASGDSIVSHAWAFRAIAAGCAPPAVASAGPSANVRFACAGTYAVDLTVTDELGAPGVASREFVIADYTGPTLLTVGPDVVVGHACTSEPRCTPSGAVTLSATTTEAAPAGLALLWSVEPPPGRELDANRRVTFDPGADSSSPAVLIETDGQAISGDWVFRVEARDAAGVVASAVTRVTVGNRPPTLTKTIPVPDHAFDGTLFTASGEVPFAVLDPDGDALVDRTVEWRHVGDGAAGLFFGSVLDAPGRVTFSIAVPYTGPADAQHLIGGAGLERSILFSISDVNGAQAAEAWPIVVGNRSPVLVAEPTGVVVPHTYDAAGLAYRAIAALSTWADPDGDPLMQVPGASTGDPQCSQLDVVGGVASATCSLAFTGTPAVANFAGMHVVAQHVQDPWAPAAAPSTIAFTIANRAPTIDAAPVTIPVTCPGGACCFEKVDPETGMIDCLAFDFEWLPGSVLVAGRWSDADGDPLSVTVTGTSSQICTPSACELPFTFAGKTVCGGAPDPIQVHDTTAGDGASTASASITANVICG